ncbi:hypothetical protein ACEQPO_08825 [Bacillus sp. SL00103]
MLEECSLHCEKSASQLGLGEQAVVLVETDEHHRMDINDLKKKLVELKEQNCRLLR